MMVYVQNHKSTDIYRPERDGQCTRQKMWRINASPYRQPSAYRSRPIVGWVAPIGW